MATGGIEALKYHYWKKVCDFATLTNQMQIVGFRHPNCPSVPNGHWESDERTADSVVVRTASSALLKKLIQSKGPASVRLYDATNPGYFEIDR